MKIRIDKQEEIELTEREQEIYDAGKSNGFYMAIGIVMLLLLVMVCIDLVCN
jgi:hypothetical protein